VGVLSLSERGGRSERQEQKGRGVLELMRTGYSIAQLPGFSPHQHMPLGYPSTPTQQRFRGRLIGYWPPSSEYLSKALRLAIFSEANLALL
jgi:hypothetical protein